MALVKCADCGNEVSDRAPACPKCGNPNLTVGHNPAQQVSTAAPSVRKSRVRVIVWSFVGLVAAAAIGVGALVYSTARDQERRREEARAQQARQRDIEAAAQREAAKLEARERQAQEEAEQRERRQATANPASVLESSDLKFFDKGILNSYRQLIAVTIQNKSKYALRGLAGQVEWLTDDGSFVGATPFSLSGSIPAGDTKRFSTQDGTLNSGTIQGNASKVRLEFNPAEIVD